MEGLKVELIQWRQEKRTLEERKVRAERYIQRVEAKKQAKHNKRKQALKAACCAAIVAICILF